MGLGLENPLHLAILLVVVLLVFGAKRLPEMGRSLGAGMRNFKDGISGRDPAATPQTEAPQLSMANERQLPHRELISDSTS
jgi:sec-independent protein translocase protein TatA